MKKKSPLQPTQLQSTKQTAEERVDKAKQIEKTQNCLGFTDQEAEASQSNAKTTVKADTEATK